MQVRDELCGGRFGEVRLGLLQPDALEGSFEEHDMAAMLRLMVSPLPQKSAIAIEAYDLQDLAIKAVEARSGWHLAPSKI